MELNRFVNDKIIDGEGAQALLDNEFFKMAVNRVLTRYCIIEEQLVVDDSQDVREITARIKHHAMMRRAVVDVVEELETLARIGRDAEMDELI